MTNVTDTTDPLPAPPRMTEAEAAQIDAEMAIGSLHAIHNLLDDGGIPRGTFADDHVRNLVALYEELRKVQEEGGADDLEESDGP